MKRCIAIKANGTQCGSFVEGAEFCFSHDPKIQELERNKLKEEITGLRAEASKARDEMLHARRQADSARREAKEAGGKLDEIRQRLVPEELMSRASSIAETNPAAAAVLVDIAKEHRLRRIDKEKADAERQNGPM